MEMTIEEIRKRYKDEWVLVEVIEEDVEGKPIKVKLLAHSRNRDDTYAAMKEYSDKYTYHFYTGEIPKKGYAVAFLYSDKTAVFKLRISSSFTAVSPTSKQTSDFSPM